MLPLNAATFASLPLYVFCNFTKFKPKSKRPASFANESGQYRFYTSSDTIKKCDILDINDEKIQYLVFGDGGTGSLFIDNKFTYSDHNIVCYTDNNLQTFYIYLYIKKYWKEFIKFHFNGSTIGNIKKENLLLTQLPIPKDLSKLKKPLSSLQILHQQITNDTELIPQKEKIICNLIKKLSDEKSGIDSPEPVAFWKNKTYIAIVIIILFVTGGYLTTKGAIDLGRNKDYQPIQPIYYSHKVHAGINQINCL